MKKIMAIFLIAVVLSACKKTFFEPEPQDNPEALFEELWGTFQSDYAVFEERNVDWEEQYTLFRPQVDASTTEDELYQVLTQMLATLNDGHVDLIAPNRKVFTSNIYYNRDSEDSLFNLDLIKSDYLTGEVLESEYEGSTYGMIGNTGYWHLKWISDNLLDAGKILDYMTAAEGLIIDLRNNGGGDMTYSFSELGRLTGEKRFTHRSKTKNGPGREDYTDWFSWYIQPETPYFNKPIVLITDRYTISAGERTTMILKTLPNVTHIGDTTNGAHSTKIGKELPNGWYYSVAPQKIEFADGQSYEGIGMIPDEYSKNTISEVQSGQDKTLELALSKF